MMECEKGREIGLRKIPALIRANEEIKAGIRTTHYGSSDVSYNIFYFQTNRLNCSKLQGAQGSRAIAVFIYLSSCSAIWGIKLA